MHANAVTSILSIASHLLMHVYKCGAPLGKSVCIPLPHLVNNTLRTPGLHASAILISTYPCDKIPEPVDKVPFSRWQCGKKTKNFFPQHAARALTVAEDESLPIFPTPHLLFLRYIFIHASHNPQGVYNGAESLNGIVNLPVEPL